MQPSEKDLKRAREICHLVLKLSKDPTKPPVINAFPLADIAGYLAAERMSLPQSVHLWLVNNCPDDVLDSFQAWQQGEIVK